MDVRALMQGETLSECQLPCQAAASQRLRQRGDQQWHYPLLADTRRCVLGVEGAQFA